VAAVDITDEKLKLAAELRAELVLVARPASGMLSIPVFDTVLNGTSVVGSIVSTRADLTEVFALHAAGRTQVSYQTRPLAGVNEAIAEVRHGLSAEVTKGRWRRGHGRGRARRAVPSRCPGLPG
jgi:D-arabinose 1-dehydrogenase-like Zn-dependent alcohol dehydrogenase